MSLYWHTASGTGFVSLLTLPLNFGLPENTTLHKETTLKSISELLDEAFTTRFEAKCRQWQCDILSRNQSKSLRAWEAPPYTKTLPHWLLQNNSKWRACSQANIRYAKRSIRIFSVSPQSHSLFSDILNSASRILQCWSYCVKINSSRHQHDTERTQNRAGL